MAKYIPLENDYQIVLYTRDKRKDKMKVVGEVRDAKGNPVKKIGQVERIVYTAALLEQTRDAVKNVLKNRFRAYCGEEMPEAAGKAPFSDALRVLRVKYSEEDLYQRVKAEFNWEETTWQGTWSYFRNQIIPALDRVGLPVGPEDIWNIQEQLINNACKRVTSTGKRDKVRQNLVGKINRCDMFYRYMQELLPQQYLPDLDLRMMGARGSDVEQVKSLPMGIRVKLVAALWIAMTTSVGGIALTLAVMLLTGLRPSECCALYHKSFVDQSGFWSFSVKQQRIEGELRRLKTVNSLRAIPVVQLLQDMIQLRRQWLAEQGYTMDQIMEMPINGKPAAPNEPVQSPLISAAGRRLLQVCGYSAEKMEKARKLMAKETDIEADGTVMQDIAAYVLRRDFASRAANICAIPAVSVDILLGHKTQLSAGERRAYASRDMLWSLCQMLERCVLDPAHTRNPAFRAVKIVPEKRVIMPPFSVFRLTGKPGTTVHLTIESQDAGRMTNVRVQGASVSGVHQIDVSDLPEERSTRVLTVPAKSRAYYNKLIAQMHAPGMEKQILFALSGEEAQKTDKG